jgi:hypothetical protein
MLDMILSEISAVNLRVGTGQTTQIATFSSVLAERASSPKLLAEKSWTLQTSTLTLGRVAGESYSHMSRRIGCGRVKGTRYLAVHRPSL